MMRKELPYFEIGSSYGGCQDWFTDYWMKIGGCAAATACDSSICLARNLGYPVLYPYDPDEIRKEDYIRFSEVMKPYLKPRAGGVDRLELYITGFDRYMRDRGVFDIRMETLDGSRSVDEAKKLLTVQVDAGLPVPCLILNHVKPAIKEYEWHWFLLNGYDSTGDRLMVKAVTYGEYEWLDMDELWDTGYQRRGGLILYRLPDKKKIHSEDEK